MSGRTFVQFRPNREFPAKWTGGLQKSMSCLHFMSPGGFVELLSSSGRMESVRFCALDYWAGVLTTVALYVTLKSSTVGRAITEHMATALFKRR